MGLHRLAPSIVTMPRPPAIHQVWRDCPSDDVVVVYGDGSIYSFPGVLREWLSVISAAVHGRQWNLFRVIRRATHVGAAATRLDALPGDLLLLYSEPPYESSGSVPSCPPPIPTPFEVQLDSATFTYWLSRETGASLVWFRSDGGPLWTYSPLSGVSFTTATRSFGDPPFLQLRDPIASQITYFAVGPSILSEFVIDPGSSGWGYPTSAIFTTLIP